MLSASQRWLPMSEQPTVLVIDDDEIVLLAMTDLLEEARFKVITRTSPIGVTRVIVDENVDVVVIDINMPVMQGDSVIRLLRSWDKFREVPVVIVSGIASQELADVKARVGEVPIVHKKSLQTDLVPVVSGCIVTRGSRTARRPTSDSDRVIERVVTELATAIIPLREHWGDYIAGRARDPRIFQQEVRKLLNRAQLVDLTEIERVLSAVDTTVSSPRLRPTAALSHAVQLSLRALEGANRRDGKLAISYQGLVDGLARALADA